MNISMLRRGAPAALLAAALAGLGLLALPSGAQAASAAPQVHVSGNRLVDQNGSQVVLHGMDRSGAEYQCVHGSGIWDGPADQASINAMKSWGAAVDAVRIPLNEACWNGESYVPAADAGANYQNAVKAFVSLLNSNGIVAIMDLQWTDGLYTGPSSGCSSAQATCLKPMPDAAEAITFWTSVAGTFKGNDAVLFDLFNEPYASRATGNTATGWTCWQNGGTCNGIGYQVAGMQQMVTAIRGTGADNVIMLGGEEYSNDLTAWLSHEPADPDHNLVASFHSYNNNTCNSQSCWNNQIAPVIAQVPLIAGEIGENDCSGSYINPLMAWLDTHYTGYLAWTWDTWSNGCGSGPTLITDYNGTPTNYGAAYKAHLATLGSGPTSPPPSTSPSTPTTSPSTSPSAPPSSSPPFSGACTAVYQTQNSWPGGFQGLVTVTAGTSAISGWTVEWNLSSGQNITQLWSGTLSTGGSAVTVKNASYNGQLAAGASTSFGFTATGSPSTPTLTCTSP